MSRPRERVIRKAVAKPEIVVVQRLRNIRFRRVRTPLILPLSFLVAILLGSLLLSLPAASSTGDLTPIDVALFTATSSICVTGLVLVDTGTYWSPFGQAVILLLIQLGGLGFITASTSLLILAGRRVGLTERLLLGESQGVLSLNGIIRITKQIVLLTVVLEAAGALILFLCFTRDYSIGSALWMGIFHSISAFNNAGFDLMGNFSSLTGYSQNAVFLLTIIILVILGSISLSVLFTVINLRVYRQLPFNSKLVLSITLALTVGGTVGLSIMEAGNIATFAPLAPPFEVLNALFMSVTRTAGFSTVDVAKMSEGSQLLLVALMYVGGASGSAAGGIKVGTFGVIVAAVVSSVRGRKAVTAFGREIPMSDVARAMTIALLAMTLIFLSTLVLVMTESFPVFPLLFETTSAFGTVGLSTGLTPSLSLTGRILIIVLMYVGRLSPLAVAYVLARRIKPEPFKHPEAEVIIG